MKIAFDAKRAFNNGTGLGNYSRFVIENLLRYYPQHEYFLFTPYIKNEFKNFVSESKNVHIVTPETLIGKAFSSLWRTYSIAKMCNKLGIEVYHGLSNELPVGMRNFKGKKIVTIHDLIFLRYPQYYRNIDRYIYNRKFQYACKTANIIVSASNQTANDIQQFYHISSEKIKTVYQDCDKIFYKKVSDEEARDVLNEFSLQKEKYVLCVGTIEERKDQLTVLKAFHKANLQGMKLVFVGRKTNYALQLDEYISANNLQNSVLMIEGLEKENLPVLYQNAFAFVYASQFEGFGIPVLEALRSGVPVLAANTSSLAEVGGNAVQYFAFGNVNELSELLKKLSDIDMRNAMIILAFEQLKNFNAEKIAGELIELITSNTRSLSV